MENIENWNDRNPLVSAIIPVYNVERYVGRCIESICNQTYRNLEIILVDDGSKDKSGRICDEYAKLDSRITVFHQSNSGLSAARNRGLDAANGEYIAFVDSDDFVSHSYIEVLLAMAEQTSSDIAQIAVEAFFEQDEFTGDSGRCDISAIHPVLLSGRDMCRAMFDNTYEGSGVAPMKIYKAHIFKDLRFPVGKLHEDDFLVYKLLWRARQVAVADTQLYFYLRRPDSIMHRKYSIKRLDGLEARKEQYHFFASVGDQELCEKAKASYIRNTIDQIRLLKASDIENKTEIVKRIRKAAIPVMKDCVQGKYITLRSKLGMVVRLCLSGF